MNLLIFTLKTMVSILLVILVMECVNGRGHRKKHHNEIGHNNGIHRIHIHHKHGKHHNKSHRNHHHHHHHRHKKHHHGHRKKHHIRRHRRAARAVAAVGSLIFGDRTSINTKNQPPLEKTSNINLKPNVLEISKPPSSPQNENNNRHIVKGKSDISVVEMLSQILNEIHRAKKKPANLMCIRPMQLICPFSEKQKECKRISDCFCTCPRPGHYPCVKRHCQGGLPTCNVRRCIKKNYRCQIIPKNCSCKPEKINPCYVRNDTRNPTYTHLLDASHSERQQDHLNPIDTTENSFNHDERHNLRPKKVGHGKFREFGNVHLKHRRHHDRNDHGEHISEMAKKFENHIKNTFKGLKMTDHHEKKEHPHGLKLKNHKHDNILDHFDKHMLKLGDHIKQDERKLGHYVEQNMHKIDRHIEHDMHNLGHNIKHDFQKLGHHIKQDAKNLGHHMKHDLRKLEHQIEHDTRKLGHHMKHDAHKIGHHMKHNLQKLEDDLVYKKKIHHDETHKHDHRDETSVGTHDIKICRDKVHSNQCDLEESHIAPEEHPTPFCKDTSPDKNNYRDDCFLKRKRPSNPSQSSNDQTSWIPCCCQDSSTAFACEQCGKKITKINKYSHTTIFEAASTPIDFIPNDPHPLDVTVTHSTCAKCKIPGIVLVKNWKQLALEATVSKISRCSRPADQCGQTYTTKNGKAVFITHSGPIITFTGSIPTSYSPVVDLDALPLNQRLALDPGNNYYKLAYEVPTCTYKDDPATESYYEPTQTIGCVQFPHHTTWSPDILDKSKMSQYERPGDTRNEKFDENYLKKIVSKCENQKNPYHLRPSHNCNCCLPRSCCQLNNCNSRRLSSPKRRLINYCEINNTPEPFDNVNSETNLNESEHRINNEHKQHHRRRHHNFLHFPHLKLKHHHHKHHNHEKHHHHHHHKKHIHLKKHRRDEKQHHHHKK